MQESGLDVNENKWDLVFDFTDTDDQGEKQVNFNLLDTNQFQIISKQIDGIDEPASLVFPTPQKYGGTATDNDLSASTPEGEVFDIKTTTAADAQKIFDEQERRRQAVQQPPQQDVDNQAPPVLSNAMPADEAFDMDDAQNSNGFGNDPSGFANNDGFAQPDQFNANSGFGFDSNFGNTSDAQPTADPFVSDEQPQQQVVEQPKGKPDLNSEFTPEELAQIEAARQADEDRLRAIRAKEDEELSIKQERRDKARQELQDWLSTKAAEKETKRKQNKDEEWAFINSREEHKQSKNQWEHIIDNVEIDPRKYEGTRDITRMRQAMIARKNDLKHQQQ